MSKEKISKEASPRFLSVAQIDLKEFRFESAENNIRLAVSLDPDNIDAVRFLGFTYLFLKNLLNQKKLWISWGKKNIRQSSMQVERFAEIKKDDAKLLTASQIPEFLDSNKNLFSRDTPPVRVIHYLVNYTYTRNEYSLAEKLSFAETAYKIITEKLDANWKLKAKVTVKS